MIPTIHPFPARMAPELALESLKDLRGKRVVLDPMSGSGTVLRHATEQGHLAVGFDMDPLAVLMSRVWTQPIDDSAIDRVYRMVIRQALALDPSNIALPWIDDDTETSAFVSFWFGPKQRKDLRCLAFALRQLEQENLSKPMHLAADVLRIALSRIIITKEQCASLARDTSHSRPHRVADDSDYSVFIGFERSLNIMRKRLIAAPPKGGAQITIGDARRVDLPDSSVDAVLTSPPYLNAIDYMRGHRLSLVWLGHRLIELRSIRSASIGTERGPDERIEGVEDLKEAMGSIGGLPSRYNLMIDRYVSDLWKMIAETVRVLKPSGQATFVVGNSCLKGIFIRNADAVAKAAELLGLNLVKSYERELPNRNRYLPITTSGSLGKRMRTETILTFAA